MTKKRPLGVTVFAILNIVFGALGLLCGMCDLTDPLWRPLIMKAQDAPTAPGKGDPMSFDQFLVEKVPTYVAVRRVQLAVGLLMSSVLIFAGIALLRMSAAGRWLCLAFGIIWI